MSTRGELRTRVVSITKRTDKTTVIDTALDMGLEEISLHPNHDWRQLVSEQTLSASDGDSSEPLPTGTHHVKEARFINGLQSYKIQLLPKTQFLRWFPNVEDAQALRPLYAYVDNSTMYFSAPLTDDFDIRALCYILPSFTDDDTEMPISVANNALTFFALGFVYDSMEMYSAASIWNRRYATAITAAMLTDVSVAGTEPVAEGFHGMPKDDAEWTLWTPESLPT